VEGDGSGEDLGREREEREVELGFHGSCKWVMPPKTFDVAHNRNTKLRPDGAGKKRMQDGSRGEEYGRTMSVQQGLP
jgi:hypothetical protein